MNLRDALFNWLQIMVVQEARPRDRSAVETARFFRHILEEDHGVEEIKVEREQEEYRVSLDRNGEEERFQFDREQVEQLLSSIEAEPKYNQPDCGPEED
ncbi:MAG: hypothetical protein M0Z65_12120 [Firmicutes bacterium]|uniref:Uncharacterized protein n=1 Tax=Melghirimyces thermohalophilus TaxID=1236220 RepID=A0A1G6HPQ9_9BACL|nr:hypothetical protein [Melghirimyces thermohalophilus]MDA8353897.1 hypothetical protein [Bacillota bacterium]SDB96133.1 hypothetical protein SAMN04488112_101140 [Melghirimyces thermohalophilus]